MTVEPQPLVDLVELADAQAYLESLGGLGIDVPEPDDLQSQITQVSAEMQRYCNRRFPLQAYDLVLDGGGGPIIVLPQYPVVAVSAVAVNGHALTSATGFASGGYRFDGTRLIASGGGRFWRGVANVEIVFTAGFAAIPADLQRACLQGLSARLTSEGQIADGIDPRAVEWSAGATKVKLAPGAISTTGSAGVCISAEVTSALAPYRRVAPL